MHEVSQPQTDRLARNGFLRLPGALDDEFVAPARDALAETVPEPLDAVAGNAAPEDRIYWGDDVADTRPFGPLNDRLHDLATSLVGALDHPGEFVQTVCRFPTGATASDPDHPRTRVDGNAHVDPFQPDGHRPFTLGATVYLADVVPRAGGFTVWPGTHRRVSECVADRPTLDDCTNDDVPGLVEGHDPFEVVGPAGTVVLWHPLLVHTGGMNLGRRARLASFTRFERPDLEATAREAAEHPFRFWDGVDG